MMKRSESLFPDRRKYLIANMIEAVKNALCREK